MPIHTNIQKEEYATFCLREEARREISHHSSRTLPSAGQLSEHARRRGNDAQGVARFAHAHALASSPRRARPSRGVETAPPRRATRREREAIGSRRRYFRRPSRDVRGAGVRDGRGDDLPRVLRGRDAHGDDVRGRVGGGGDGIQHEVGRDLNATLVRVVAFLPSRAFSSLFRIESLRRVVRRPSDRSRLALTPARSSFAGASWPRCRSRRRWRRCPRGRSSSSAKSKPSGAKSERSREAGRPDLSGAFYTLVPIRPRRRGERRSLRTFPGVSLLPPPAFNPRPRRLSTSTDAFQLHPDIRLLLV